jgi:hypothetical protein
MIPTTCGGFHRLQLIFTSPPFSPDFFRLLPAFFSFLAVQFLRADHGTKPLNSGVWMTACSSVSNSALNSAGSRATARPNVAFAHSYCDSPLRPAAPILPGTMAPP